MDVKLVVIYPQPTNVDVFEKVYQEEHVPLAVAKLGGKTKIVATRILGSPQGTPRFYRVAEVYFPSLQALEACAASEGGREALAHAVKISSGGPPIFLVAEEETFTFTKTVNAWEKMTRFRLSITGLVSKPRGLRIAVIAVLFLAGLCAPVNGQENLSTNHTFPPSVGLEIGQHAPAFALPDQFGHTHSNETLKGSKGTVLLFFRSADWWPFCKAQLVQLQGARQRFEAQGLKLAAISYDSPAILKDFAKRHRIDFPLLADPGSEIIRSFNVLNTEAKGMTKGMAYPGFIYIDESGMIREKYFQAKYTNRFTANNVIGKLFPELTEEVSQNIEAPHLRLTLTQSDRTVVPGSRVTLGTEIELPPGVHVYSPGVKGYKPIQLALQPASGIELSAATYPNSKVLYLEAIQERVPIFEGNFRITQDVTVTPSKTGDVVRSLVSAQKTISITGELKYQACDKAICYPPVSVPLKWQLQMVPLDLKRSPNAIQHK